MTGRWKVVLGGALIFATVLAGCSTGSDHELENSLRPVTVAPGEAVRSSFNDSRVAGMKGVAENKRLQLYIDDQTAEIAVLDKASGEVWRSNPESRDSDPLAAGVNKGLLSAQARIHYTTMLGQSGTVNTYTDGVANKQVAFEAIPGGIKVTYQLGKDERSAENLPKKLSKARFEELLGRVKENKTAQRSLIIAYKENKKEGIYDRNDGALSGFQLTRAFDAFEDAGYTEEDLAQDNAEFNLETNIVVPKIFNISIEYTLDEDSLVAKVPVDSIRFPDNYPVNQISLLSFFGAGGTDEQGSLFVPDGSGALVHFNNGKAKYPAYQQDVYGKDMTMDNVDFFSNDQKIRMPVFGVIKQNSAYLAMIEQGASVAIINADVAGRVNSFNYVYPSFYVMNKEEVTLRALDKKRELPKFQEQPMKTDYVVRYAFMNGDDASYQGMARYYQQYLVNKQMLKPGKSDTGEDIPFYLQLIGSIDKQKHILGIPYQSIEPMTTLEQAKSIIAQLNNRNIDTIKLGYAGWFNGGVAHKVPKNIKVDSSIGGKKGLADFLKFTEASGVEFYPDMAITSVNNTSGFWKTSEASRRLTEQPAAVYPIDMALNRRNRDREPSYVLSPRLIGSYVESALKDLNKLNINHISLSDLADQVNSDFRKSKQIDRAESEKLTLEALAHIQTGGIKIMGDGGNAYAFPYLSDITNAPMSSSKFKIEDEEVPFYQMVIRGYIDYTGAPYNLSTYTNAKQYMLKSLELGSNVYFTWSHEPNFKVKETEYDYLYAINYEQWIDLADEMYREVNGVLRHVIGQGIVAHSKLHNGVFKTVYENGLYVIVNYNLAPVSVNGMTIDAESYVTGGERS